MLRPKLSRIRVYPIKSLDPVELTEAEIGIRSLRYDRQYAMLSDSGRFINGKSTGRVNELKAEYDLPNRVVRFSERFSERFEKFNLSEQKDEIEKYLSLFFQTNVRLVSSVVGELMDIPNACSVSILSDASLISLRNDFQELSDENLRLRFRANLELSGLEAYGEEKLFGEPGVGISFKIGDVEMIGISPRARCNVPPRDPFTGTTDKSFVKTMMNSRSVSLPNNSLLPKHGNFYHLTVNTFIPDGQNGKFLKIGDKLEIIGPVNLGA